MSSVIPVITDDDINRYKILKSLKEYGRNLLFALSQDFYYDHESSLGGTRTIEEFINNLTKKPKISIQNEIKQFKCTNEIDDNLDISSCFNIILLMHVTGCKYFQEASGEEIFENVKKIKNMRNELYHKYKYESKEIEMLKETLINSMTRICRNMIKLNEEYNKERFNKINTRYKMIEKNFNKGIPKIWNDTYYGKTSQLKELLEEKGDFESFINDCRDDLSAIYKKYYASSPMLEDKFNFSVEDIFVAPMLKKNRNIAEVNLYIPYDKILSEKNEKKTTVPNVIIVTADAGHGKTTLCKKFTLEWCNLDSSLANNFTLLLLIEVKKATEAGVCQYIKEVLLQDSLLKATEEEISLFLQQLKVLIIIDAYDERSREAKTLISSVLDLLSEKTIIITTRPHCLKDITEEVKKRNLLYTQYDLEGLKSEIPFIENIWKHLGKRDKNFSLKLDNFFKFIKELPPDFGNLLKVPLIAFLLTYLWINTTEQGISLENLSFTTLYKQVKDLQIESILRKIISNIKEKIGYPDAKIKIENFITIVAEMCYMQAKAGEPMILNSKSLDCLNKYLEEQGFNKDNIKIIMSTIFMSNRSLRNLNVYNYEFLHKSYFEYLVAFYSSGKLVNANCRDVKSINDLQIFNNRNFGENPDTFSFFLGILAETDKLDEYMVEIGEILKENNLYGKFNIVWKFLRQTLLKKSSTINDYRPNKRLCRAFKECFLKDEWKLTTDDVISGLYILMHLINIDPLKETSVCIEINRNFPESDIKIFKYLIMRVNKKLIQEKKNVTFEIYFFYDQIKNESIFSDVFMSQINPKHFNITKFWGFIENDKSIEHVTALVNLYDIELTINKIEILQKLNEACRNKKRLKFFRLRFEDSFLSTRHGKKLPNLNLNCKDVNINVQYKVRVWQDILQTISNLAEIEHREKGFYSVTIICDDEKEDKKVIRKWVQKFHEKIRIWDKLTVKSLFEIDDDFKDELEQLVVFKIRWELKF